MSELITGIKPFLILASKSPRRSALLSLLGIPFETFEAVINEVTAGTPIETTSQNAIAKAQLCLEYYPNSLILSADTVIEFKGKQIGKPKNIDQAKQFLLDFSGKTHTVITTVCLLGHDHIPHLATDLSKISFFKLSPNDADEYLRKVDALDKAGGYGIQEYGWWLIRKLKGSLDNVMGLPLSCVMHLLSLAHINSLL